MIAIQDAGIAQLAPIVGIARACRAVGRSRASYYRTIRGPRLGPPRPRPRPARALSDAEREDVVAVINSDRFIDLPPAQIWARLLDEDATYLCSISTMYRLLRERDQVHDRRRRARHPAHVKPELVAVASRGVVEVRGHRS